MHGTDDGQHPHDDRGPAVAPVMDEAFWDERYRSAPALWSGEPNGQLVAEVTGDAPGRALDVGCGEGADAIWLARAGWSVTGVDIAGTALERARTHAGAAGDGIADRITWMQRDLSAWVPDPEAFDLVSAQYLPVPAAERPALRRRLADAVAPGGTLLLVDHDPSGLAASDDRRAVADFFATADETVAALPSDDWEILVAEARPRPVTDPDGNRVAVDDVVVVARKRSTA